jgi:hypothetical protein
MFKFIFEATHDKGKIKLSTFAPTEQVAKDIICNLEGCPPWALKLIQVV